VDQSIEKVEALIADYMREQGVKYVAADYKTVRAAILQLVEGFSIVKLVAFGKADEYEGIMSHGLNEHIFKTTIVIVSVLISLLMIYYVLID
jgi:hypothetical protein